MGYLQKLVYNWSILPRLNKLKKLLPEAHISPAGSRYVCNPPVLFTDVDFLVYHASDISLVHKRLIAAGYKRSSSNNEYFSVDEFWAYRRGVENIIVAKSRHYAESFEVATTVCKLFNIRHKSARVIVHQYLRYYEESFSSENDEYLSNLNGVHSTRSDFYAEVKQLLSQVTAGPYAKALRKAFKLRHNIDL